MYKKIVNPITNRKVNINSSLGKSILNKYIIYGGSDVRNAAKLRKPKKKVKFSNLISTDYFIDDKNLIRILPIGESIFSWYWPKWNNYPTKLPISKDGGFSKYNSFNQKYGKSGIYYKGSAPIRFHILLELSKLSPEMQKVSFLNPNYLPNMEHIIKTANDANFSFTPYTAPDGVFRSELGYYTNNITGKTTWNHPNLKAIKPTLKYPDTPFLVFSIEHGKYVYRNTPMTPEEIQEFLNIIISNLNKADKHILKTKYKHIIKYLQTIKPRLISATLPDWNDIRIEKPPNPSSRCSPSVPYNYSYCNIDRDHVCYDKSQDRCCLSSDRISCIPRT